MRELTIGEVHVLLGICVRYLQDRADREKADGPAYRCGGTEEATQQNVQHRAHHNARVAALTASAELTEEAYDRISKYVPGFEDA